MIWLTYSKLNKKTSPEKLAATQGMFYCKPFKMTSNLFNYFNMAYLVCLEKYKEDMLSFEKNQ